MGVLHADLVECVSGYCEVDWPIVNFSAVLIDSLIVQCV